MPLDPESNVPLYQQLASVLRGQIDAGEIPAHRAIPSKKTLVQDYGVSPGTVERAYDVLKAEGLAVMRPGWGTFVAERPGP